MALRLEGDVCRLEEGASEAAYVHALRIRLSLRLSSIRSTQAACIGSVTLRAARDRKRQMLRSSRYDRAQGHVV